MVKQYFKEERALRTETTINDPGDFKVNKGLKNLVFVFQLELHNGQLLVRFRIE